MFEYENKNASELKEILKRLQDNLSEIEEERIFVLGQTGLHVPGAKVKQYEAEINEIKKHIAKVEDLLKK